MNSPRFGLAPNRLTIVRGYPWSNCCTTTTRTKCYVVVPTTTHLTFRTRNVAKNTILQQLSRHEAKRERPRPPPAESGGASKARHVQETAGREVDLSLSYLEDGSKPGLNRTRRLLSCKGQHTLEKMKKFTSVVRSTQKVFDQNSALQAACDTSDRACFGVCIPSWRMQVGDSPANARVNRTKTSTLFCVRKLYNPHWGGQNQTSVEFSMHEAIIVTVFWDNFWSGYLGLPGSYASSCVLPINVAGQRRSSPGLMLGLLVLSSHDGTCGGRRSLLFRSDLSSALYRINTY